ncbi:hypothetical protein G3R49_16185 [Shewanella sp. WXL01]|uniref:hypothetical protein n=1 Tax=Shewanella sp. WXL01 TaxID=2709721 RepID=UPI0014384062|nr:hypothetical protein [Shewanella sp. WXL01]NKF52104.1 hypothetical protein [Shewanella sp. WXL01]
MSIQDSWSWLQSTMSFSIGSNVDEVSAAFEQQSADEFTGILQQAAVSQSMSRMVSVDVPESLSSVSSFSVSAIQQQLLSEVGLADLNSLSLNVSDAVISVLQQGFLMSLQTSMVQSAISNSVAATTDAEQQAELGDGLDSFATYAFGDDGLNAQDAIDTLNVLNHTPIVSSVYQGLTGKEVSPAANVVGSALYAGPMAAGATAVELGVDYFNQNHSTGLWSAMSSMFSEQAASDNANNE